jgi:hypothetical protein
VLFLGCYTIHAQEIITTAGDYSSNNSVSLSWTLGELVTGSFSDNNTSVVQGFQQPAIVTSVIETVKDINLQILLSPNPTSDRVNLWIENVSNAKLQYYLIDLNGKIILQNSIMTNRTEILFNTYTTGIYILKITNSGKPLKTFKIVKQ